MMQIVFVNMYSVITCDIAELTILITVHFECVSATIMNIFLMKGPE